MCVCARAHACMSICVNVMYTKPQGNVWHPLGGRCDCMNNMFPGPGRGEPPAGTFGINQMQQLCLLSMGQPAAESQTDSACGFRRPLSCIPHPITFPQMTMRRRRTREQSTVWLNQSPSSAGPGVSFPRARRRPWP